MIPPPSACWPVLAAFWVARSSRCIWWICSSRPRQTPQAVRLLQAVAAVAIRFPGRANVGAFLEQFRERRSSPATMSRLIMDRDAEVDVGQRRRSGSGLRGCVRRSNCGAVPAADRGRARASAAHGNIARSAREAGVSASARWAWATGTTRPPVPAFPTPAPPLPPPRNPAANTMTMASTTISRHRLLISMPISRRRLDDQHDAVF